MYRFILLFIGFIFVSINLSITLVASQYRRPIQKYAARELYTMHYMTKEKTPMQFENGNQLDLIPISASQSNEQNNNNEDQLDDTYSDDDNEKVNHKNSIKDDSITVYEGSTLTSLITPEMNFNASSYTLYNFTIVCTLQSTEMYYIPILVKMWPSYISIAIHVTSQNTLSSLIQHYLSFQLPSRVRIAFAQSTFILDSSQFPINHLRNLAIRNSITTHYIVIDSGILLDANLLTELTKLNDIECNEKTALILPLVFNQITSIKQDYTHFIKYWKAMPQSKSQLFSLLQNQSISFQSQTSNHNYILEDWFYIKKQYHSIPISCLNSYLQQPFVLLRHSQNVPLFDERFVGHYFNRVQQIEYLRLLGFQFRLLANTYAEVLPKSTLALQINSQNDNEQKYMMKRAFIDWYMEVVSKRVVNRTRLCSKEEKARREKHIQLLLKSPVL